MQYDVQPSLDELSRSQDERVDERLEGFSHRLAGSLGDGVEERCFSTRGFLLRYDVGMSLTKRKISVSLDESLVAELESTGESVSAQINNALQDEISRRRRHSLLNDLLGRMDAQHGPVEESLIEKYLERLG